MGNLDYFHASPENLKAMESQYEVLNVNNNSSNYYDPTQFGTSRNKLLLGSLINQMKQDLLDPQLPEVLRAANNSTNNPVVQNLANAHKGLENEFIAQDLYHPSNDNNTANNYTENKTIVVVKAETPEFSKPVIVNSGYIIDGIVNDGNNRQNLKSVNDKRVSNAEDGDKLNHINVKRHQGNQPTNKAERTGNIVESAPVKKEEQPIKYKPEENQETSNQSDKTQSSVNSPKKPIKIERTLPDSNKDVVVKQKKEETKTATEKNQ
jgi:hypothetical protein